MIQVLTIERLIGALPAFGVLLSSSKITSFTQCKRFSIDFLLLFREQGTLNREQKEELRLKASKTLYF
jgi:hypothetical protein